MCEFCLQHGEGQKWYLQAKNYSEDLLSDARRRKFIAEFFSVSAEERGQSVRGMDASVDQLNRAPGIVRSMITRRMGSQARKEHHGQVLPIEDVEKILEFVNSVVRVACVCRMGIYGPEPRFCYGISMAPPEVGLFAFLRDEPSYKGGPVMDSMETQPSVIRSRSAPSRFVRPSDFLDRAFVDAFEGAYLEPVVGVAGIQGFGDVPCDVLHRGVGVDVVTAVGGDQ